MEKAEAAAYLAGAKQVEGAEASAPTNLHVISGEVVEKSENGKVKVDLGGLVFNGDDEQAVEIDTLGGLEVGDTATILLTGQENRGMTPLGVGGVGTTDRISQRVSSIEADYVKADILEANYAHITDGVIDNAKIDHADVNNLNANYAHISSGVIDNAQINGADIVNGTITGTKIAQASITGSNIDASTFTNGQISGAKIDASTFTDGQISGAKINASTLTDIPYAEIDELKAKEISADDIEAAHAYVSALSSSNITAQNIVADHATIGNLNNNYAQINLANVNTAQITNGVIQTAAIVNEQVFTVTGNKATITSIDASKINVTNLNADNITVNKINGQTVTGKSISDALTQHETDISAKVDTTTFNSTVSGLNDRIDGAIETFTGTVVPTLNNTPASAWDTNAKKDQHVGDVYYVVNSNPDAPSNGWCYRFAKISEGQYDWVLIKDSDVTAALTRLRTVEGVIGDVSKFDEDIATFLTDENGEFSRLQTRTTSLETSMGDKVDSSTFNTVSQKVDSNEASITRLGQTVEQKADSSTVTTLSNTVNTVQQTANTNTASITSLTQTVNQKADSSTVTTLTQRTSKIEQNLTGITTRVSATESSISGHPDCWRIDRYSLPARVNTNQIVPVPDDFVEENFLDTRYRKESDMGTNLNIDNNYVAKLTTYVHATEATTITDNFQHDDASAVYLNDEYIAEAKGTTVISVTLNLRAGWNKIRFLLNEQTGADYARFATRISTWSNVDQQVADLNEYEGTVQEQRLSSAETSIEQNTEAITLRATKSVVSQTVRNLLSGTATPDVKNESHSTHIDEIAGGTTIYKWVEGMTLSKVSGAIRMEFTGNNQGIVVPLVAEDCITDGETVTISYTYRTNIQNKAFNNWFLHTPSPNANNAHPIALDGDEEWHDASVSWNVTLKTGTAYAMLLFYGSTANGNWIEIKDGTLFLERGDTRYASQAELTVANNNIDLKVSKNDVINQINVSDEDITINAARVNIEGATIFSRGRLSQTSLNNAYDAKGAAATAKSEAISTAASDATSKANAAKSSAISTASADATAKANAVQANLDNLQIGGRNLLFKTADFSESGTSTSYFIEYIVNNGKLDNSVTLEEGVEYTFSADVTSSLEPFQLSIGAGNGAFSRDVASANNSTSGRVSVTFTPTAAQLSSGKVFAFRAPRYSTQGTSFTYSVSFPKLEKGNKATDWTPAPEDQVESAYATCSTAAGTAAKVVDASGMFDLHNGVTITVKFTTANTADAPTLNVNDTGAYPVWNNNAVAASGNPVKWGANATLSFIFDSSHWVLAEKAPSYSIACTTAATTRAKAATINGALVVNGTTVAVLFSTANTYVANSVQFNLSSTGAVNIYLDRAATSATHTFTWSANTVITLVRNGAGWYVSDGRAKDSVSVSQRIYYRSTSSTKPDAPSAWVEEATENVYDAWTTKVPPLAASTAEGQTKYIYLWTCEQRKAMSGSFLGCTDVQLDENTTVIDGGNIITHSIAAESIQANSLTLGQISTTTQADILNAKVQVGGRNLLTSSADISECFDSISKVTSIVGGYADPDGGNNAFLITPNATSWYAGPKGSRLKLTKLGVPYTFSIWLRADNATQCKLCCRYMDSTPYSSTATRAVFDVTTEWQRFFISAPLKQIQTSDSVWIGQVTTEPIYAYHPMVEMSSTPSDWTPAPEDQTTYVDGSIEAVQNSITESSDLLNEQIGGVAQKADDADAAAKAAQATADSAASAAGALEVKTSWLHFDDAAGTGLHIGKTNSPFQTVVDEDSMDFMYGDQLLAKASGVEGFSADLMATKTLSLGDYAIAESGGMFVIDYIGS